MPSVLVTGAGRGIGLAITEHMSCRGWNVYATARSGIVLNSLDRIPNVYAIALDITDRSGIAALPDQLPAELNGVVNNAGIIVNGPVEGLSLDDLTQQLDINVISQIAVTQAVLPKIRAARGRVVFMSSVSGLFTTPGTGAYNASKYAIESLADALRMELRPWRIPVSLIEPGHPYRHVGRRARRLRPDDQTAQRGASPAVCVAPRGKSEVVGTSAETCCRSQEGHQGRRSR